MPQLHELEMKTVAASVGGSALFEEDNPIRLNCETVARLRMFCQELLDQGRSVILVIGGGELARIRQADAENCGVKDQEKLDKIGIHITRANAGLISDILVENAVPVRPLTLIGSYDQGVVYIGGGTEPGHTSDYPAVQAAHEAGASVLLNIGARPGLHPVTPEGFNSEEIIKELTLREYRQLFPGSHKSGENIPFDREGTDLAIQYGMIVVLLGPDFDNIRKCTAGEEFVGTILRP